MSVHLLVRMTAPITAISLLLLTLGVVAAWYVHRLEKNVSDLLAEDVSSVRAAEEVEIGIREVQAQLHHFLLTGDRRHLEAVPTLRQETDRWLSEAERLAKTPREETLITQVRQGYDRFFEEFHRLSHQIPVGGVPREVRELVDNLITKDILPPAQAYLTINEEAVETTSHQNQVLAERLVLALLLLGTCGAVAGLLTGYGLARGISRSIVQLSVPIRDAAGKLNEVVGPITVSAGWSFQELEALLRRIADQIGTVVERLQHSQREVLRAEQLASVGQLAAGLAHELRNPLTSMKILVQSAAARLDSPELRGRDLVVLEEEITRLQGSIQNFLDFARPPQPQKRPVEVRGVVEQTVCLVSGRAEHQSVRLECELPDEPVVVEADMGQLRQVLLNLLLNALDAVPGGGRVRVQVRLGEVPDKQAKPPMTPGRALRTDQWLTIRVADDGCGLPADLGERIFEPFVSTKDTGTGLGLPICKRIVEAHGGAIAAVDQANGGAVFTVRLPLLGGK
jgi:signal transduction histidine kinase